MRGCFAAYKLAAKKQAWCIHTLTAILAASMGNSWQKIGGRSDKDVKILVVSLSKNAGKITQLHSLDFGDLANTIPPIGN